MKTLIRKVDGLSLYLFDDNEVVNLEIDKVIVGDTKEPRYIIGDLTESTSAVIENITPPNDWVGGKYILASGQWIDANQVNPPRSAFTRVSPVQFKLLFTPQERVAIKQARATDLIIDDFYDIVEDPRLAFVDLDLQSTKDAVQYLASKNLIDSARVAQILTGVMK